MAKRRMFNLSVVDDDVFLSMPASAQALYFHLGMRADDDGFITPLKVMRAVGVNQDDLGILIAKKYVLPFDSGVVVIKAWPVQNSVKKDRYIPTTYQKEFKQLTFNEWGAYTFKRKSQTQLLDVNSNTTLNRGKDDYKQQNGSQVEPQYRLGKVSIGYNSTNARAREAWFDFWKQTTGIDQRRDNMYNHAALVKLLERFKPDELKQLIMIANTAHSEKYAPKQTRVADFYQLEQHADDILVWGKGKITAKKGIVKI